MNKPLSALPKLGILVALVSCLTAEAHSTVSRVDLLPNSEETFNFMDLDDNNEVSRYEFAKPFVEHLEQSQKKAIKDSRVVMAELGLRKVTDEEANDALRRSLATQRRAIERVFDGRDGNGDSVLDLEEFLGPSRAAEIFSGFMDTTFETMDANGDDVISLDEFISAMKLHLDSRIAEFEEIESEVKRQEAAALMERRLNRQFTQIDLNKDGHLTHSEVEEVKSWPVISNPHPPNAVRNYIESLEKKANSNAQEG